ncbi:glycosyltransferase family 4 protein, partial [candidate division WOR-3 bacterium]|nr:glycosyltransferase family 4 protein [candidate division WOR-3 bacterium]
MNQKSNIVIITSPLNRIAQNFLLRYIKIFQAFSGEIYAITGGTFSKSDIFNKGVYIEEVRHMGGKGIANRIFQYILTQLKISYLLVKKRDADVYVFFLGQALILPILTLKIMRKKIILAMGGSYLKLCESKNDYLLLPLKIIEKISCKLSDHIIVYSENIIKDWDLEKYKNKISIAHHHFFDFDKFKIKKKLEERDNLVGYIGRLSEEKGTLNFVKAIPKILKERNEIEFLIGGDGQLRDKIERYLEGESLNDKIKLTGWIPDEEFSTYLNELKLFVLPSYTEGLPYTLLEAMACGTPVLATPVGAIPDVIKD